MNWGDILKNYGVPVFFLLIVLGFIYKLLWPLILKLLETSEKRTTEFLAAIASRDEISKNQTIVLEKLSKNIEEYRKENRRNREDI